MPFNPWASTSVSCLSKLFLLDSALWDHPIQPQIGLLLTGHVGELEAPWDDLSVLHIWPHGLSKPERCFPLSFCSLTLLLQARSWTVAIPHHVKNLSCCWILPAPPSFYDCPDVG